MNSLGLQKGERNQHRFLVIFCDEIIGSKNHRENSLSFSLLKSESVNMCFVRKHKGNEQFDQKSPDLWVFSK